MPGRSHKRISRQAPSMNPFYEAWIGTPEQSHVRASLDIRAGNDILHFGLGHRMASNVLVVDDEPNVRAVLRDILLVGDSDYDVEEAVDGRDALEKARAATFGTVLADIMMPRMNGVELLRALQKEQPHLPVIIITAVRDREDILECLALGAWDYILKPFDIHQVRSATRRALAVAEHLVSSPDDIEIVSSGPDRLELTAASEVEYLHRFRKFTEVLLRTQLSTPEREDIRLAVEELGRNAIEWGNRYDRDKRVRLSFSTLPDRIVFRIEDEGEGFIHRDLRDPSKDPLRHMNLRREEDKRPGGYGIFIVRKIMDEVEFNEAGNVVVMTKRLR